MGMYSANADDLVLIVNKSNPVASITSQEAKNIFLGKKKNWQDNSPINLVVQEDTSLHKLFTVTIVNKSPLQFSIYWKKLLFTGQALYPERAANDADVINYIQNHKNSVGYIAGSSANSSVKVIEVQ
jgi:ABC-type phosphate transport system substrate-binding protein